MGARLELNALLKRTIQNDNVYFQQPEKNKLKYPCVIYHMNGSKDSFANNELYRGKTRYDIQLIDKSPDTALFQKIKSLPYCRFDRFYTADNLNHFVFTIYF